MDIFLFTLYVLMWPAGALGVLVLLVVAFTRDLLTARREGKVKELV